MKAKRAKRPVDTTPKQQITRFTPLPPPDPAAGIPEARGPAPFADPELRRAMIAEAAYYRAEKRGFEPGGELEDWCAAEGDIDTLLERPAEPGGCDAPYVPAPD